MNFRGWKIDSIENITTRVKVGFVGSCEKYYCSETDGIPMIRTTNLKENGIDFSDLKYVTKEFHTKNVKSQLRQNNILVARHGDNGKACLYTRNIEANCLNVIVIETDHTQMIPKFLKYLFDSSIIKNQVSGAVVGTVQNVVNTKAIAKVRVPVPKLEEQKAIADTLSCLDEKIAINNRINKTLEEMAQAIFKSWFVDFEPFQDGEFEDSELGKIPKGWRVDNIDNNTSIVTRGITPKYVDISKQYVINQKCIRGGSLNTTLSRTHCSVVNKEKMLQFGDILINSIGVGTLGRVAQVYEELENFTVDTHVTIVRPNTSNRISYMGCLLKNMQPNFEHAGTGSTGQTELGRDAIKQMHIIVPNDSAMEEFSQIYDLIYKKIVSGQKENILLSNIRDSLLPQLMSGEIRVPTQEVQ